MDVFVLLGPEEDPVEYDPTKPIGVAMNDAAAGERVEIALNANGRSFMQAGPPLADQL